MKLKNLPLNGKSTEIKPLDYFGINGKNSNGFGSRLTKKYSYIVLYVNKKPKIYHCNKEYTAFLSNDEIDSYTKNFKLKYPKTNSNKIIGIYFCGEKININSDYPISDKIKKKVLQENNKECCVCGSKENLHIDHKDDLYKDKKALSTLTQKTEHFQLLCNNCNIKKRGGKYNRERKIEKSFTDFPYLRPFEKLKVKLNYENNYDIKYIDGERKNINRFWYDPIKFMEKMVSSIINKFNLLKDENKMLKDENKMLKEKIKLLKD